MHTQTTHPTMLNRFTTLVCRRWQEWLSSPSRFTVLIERRATA